MMIFFMIALYRVAFVSPGNIPEELVKFLVLKILRFIRNVKK